MAIIKKTNKWWWGYGEERTLLHCCWKCKLVQPLWQTVWRLLKKLKIELPVQEFHPWAFIKWKWRRTFRVKNIYIHYNHHNRPANHLSLYKVIVVLLTIFLCSTLHPHGLFMYIRAFLVAQRVKNLSTMHEMWETWVQSLGWENPLSRKRHPLQYSCLENSVGRGAWWATVHGVTESHTWLSMSAMYVNIELLLYTWNQYCMSTLVQLKEGTLKENKSSDNSYLLRQDNLFIY